MTSPHPAFLYREDGRVDHAAMTAAANKVVNQARRERLRAEAASIAAAAVRALQGQVQTALRPPPGRLWKVDVEARIIVGPAGGIGTTPVIVRTLEALATPGRHDEGVVARAWLAGRSAPPRGHGRPRAQARGHRAAAGPTEDRHPKHEGQGAAQLTRRAIIIDTVNTGYRSYLFE